VTETDLSKVVESGLKMDMSVKSAQGRMKLLFVEYKSLLRAHGLKWVTDKTPKIAIKHVISAVKPAQLRTRLEQDIAFSHHDLRADFTGFMKHAIDLSSAFQRVDNGPLKSRKGDKDLPKSKKDVADGSTVGSSSSKAGVKYDGHSKKAKKKPPTPCPLPKCHGKNRFHWMSDCTESTETEKAHYRAELATLKAQDGPSKSTRGQASKTVSRLKQEPDTTGRDDGDQPSCRMTVQDTRASLGVIGRCEDGSDETLVSKEIAEKAVLQGIGKLEAVATVRLEVALKKKGSKATFPFSRAWTVPSTVLHLSSGRLALKNITFLVADDDDAMVCEDLLIGLPVLKHLRVDTKTLLEENITALDGTDCGLIDAPRGPMGKLGRLMTARLNGQGNAVGTASRVAATDRPKVHYHQARHAEDPFPDPSLLDPIDNDQHDDIRKAVENIQTTAKKNGLADIYESNLRGILHAHLDIFRTSFSAGPPAKLPPLKIELMPDAKPVKVRLRKYSQAQKEFMRKFVDDLVANGMAYPNPTSRWACAPLLVPKPGALFRFTVDLKPVNVFTIKHQYPMPNLEHELSELKDAVFFANFDMSHGYWQLLLSLISQECQSFITPDGVFTPTRVLHGTTNAVTHLQASLASVIPASLRPNILCWLDDILIHAPTVEKLFEFISMFFKLCVDYNIKLHPAKCILYTTEICWCGRLISANGIRYDPRRLDGLLTMAPPATGANLQQFLCALQWLKQGIPNFTALVAPLHDFMERVYGCTEKRTKRAVSRVLLSAHGWGPVELDAFERCKKALASQVTLSHRDPSQRLCVYTDASDMAWSGIVTQVPLCDVSKPHAEQRHSPIAFLSGRFDKTQLGWSVLEKEAFAVMNTLDRMHWIVATPDGFDLYTDHNNLIFLFDPLAVVPDMSQTSLRKVLRWAVKLSVYRYTCYHIKGADNVWADLLTRWSHAPDIVRRLVHIPELPSSCRDDFEWPTPSTIALVQEQHKSVRPTGVILKDELWTYPDTAVWVPDDASDLQLRLCIIAHTGPAGHRGREATSRALRSYFKWSTVSEDVSTFVRACIHCLSTLGGEKIPRPFGPSVHGTKPNDLLQFDYIHLGPSHNGDQYVLMMRDDHSDYKMFYCFPSTDAENAATAIIEWCSLFGVPGRLMSDGPTHFKNETVRLVSKGLKVPHHFTLPYCPWSNGAVERLGKELLRVLRATLSELQMDNKEWPDLIPMVQSVLNNSPSPQRGNVFPCMAFMGRDPTPPVCTFLRSATATPVTVSQAIRESQMNTEELVTICGDLHPRVHQTLARNRKLSRELA